MKSVSHLWVCLLLASTLGWAESNPIPLISQPVVPTSAAPGSGAFTLTVHGANFSSTATVYWNGSLRPTTMLSANTVQAQISAGDVAKAGIAWVTVGNLGSGEVFSNAIYFPIRNSAAGTGFLPRVIQNVLSPGSVVAGDFNNDGLLDFAVGSQMGLQVFLGKGNGTFQPPLNPSSQRIGGLITGDFNGDGKLDLAEIGGFGLVNIFLGKGDGTFSRLKGVAANTSVLVAADFNGDGALDLYVNGLGNRKHPAWGIMFGRGDGTFDPPSFRGQLPPSAGVPAIGDFDGQGFLEVAIPGAKSTGEPIIQVSDRVYSLKFGGQTVAAADVNGDGKLDLVTDGVTILLGNGDGTFRQGGGVIAPGSFVNVADFNGDGNLDIASGLSILFGNGKGHFQVPITFAGMESNHAITLGAFNGNGNLDLVGVNDLNGSLSIYEQRPAYFFPIKLDFGDLKVGKTTPPQTASLKNVGTVTLTDLTVSIDGSNNMDFAQTNNCPPSLPPNGACEMKVTFTPGLVGQESASLAVAYKGSAALGMPLSGTGLANSLFKVSLTPASLIFVAQLVETDSPPQPALLTNIGNQLIAISSIVVTAPFTETNDCPDTLSPGQSCEIDVVFTPTDRGLVNGTLSVTDNAKGSPQKISLSGSGAAVVITPDAINFGNQKVGSSSVPVPLTLNNLGTSALSINQIVINGANSGDFTQTNNCGNSVPAKGQCTITVTFTPKANGTRSGQVSIKDNDPSSPQRVPLSGTGT